LQTRWVGKNVDLEELSRHVSQFLKDKGFEIVVENAENSHRIMGFLRVGDKRRGVWINVNGAPNDVLVDFSSNKEGKLSLLAGPLVTMFGGGVFVLDRLKRQEFYEKLEAEFWLFLEEIIEHPTST
jgi:tRNA1(Val) A37 N6-methylase TrmN6